ncbi:MAG: DoxX family protein [Rhodospirillales bacterium]|nr:DoxX family protein [Rhodospirillales bacterium]
MTDGQTSQTPKRIIPALGSIYDSFSCYSYPLIRFTCGILLVPHGYRKLFQGGIPNTAKGMAAMGLEPATFFAWYIGSLEFFGGIMLAIGLLTRPVAALVVGFMAVAAFHVHWANGFYWINKGYEVPLFWGLVTLAILIRGGGNLSLDKRIGKEL